MSLMESVYMEKMEKERKDLETELLKVRLEKLDVLLDYKNRSFCKKYLKKILKEFF